VENHTNWFHSKVIFLVIDNILISIIQLLLYYDHSFVCSFVRSFIYSSLRSFVGGLFVFSQYIRSCKNSFFCQCQPLYFHVSLQRRMASARTLSKLYKHFHSRLNSPAQSRTSRKCLQHLSWVQTTPQTFLISNKKAQLYLY